MSATRGSRLANKRQEVRMKSATAQTSTENLDTRELLKVLTAFKKGDFSARMPVDKVGVAGKIADTLNEVLELNEKMAKEFAKISTAVGKEGKITLRASMGDHGGGWASCVDSINTLIVDVVQPSTEVARVIGAGAKGDLSQTMALEVDGRALKGGVPRPPPGVTP